MEVAAAKEKLDAVENRLALKTSRMESYDKAITKSEAAYLKILESSQARITPFSSHNITQGLRVCRVDFDLSFPYKHGLH